MAADIDCKPVICLKAEDGPWPLGCPQDRNCSMRNVLICGFDVVGTRDRVWKTPPSHCPHCTPLDILGVADPHIQVHARCMLLGPHVGKACGSSAMADIPSQMCSW